MVTRAPTARKKRKKELIKLIQLLPPALLAKCASEIELERVEWIWFGRLAKGKHTCIAGEPGTGKSQLSIYIACPGQHGEPLALQ